MGLKPLTNLQDCRFFVIEIPFEKTTTYIEGTKNGPRAIIQASNEVELYDDELKISTYKKGIYTLKPINCRGNLRSVLKRINKMVCGLLNYKAIPFFIGGEHSITPAIVAPFIKKYKDLSVLHFDAHSDLRPSYEGKTYSHACAMHKISKKCKIAQVGIRSISYEELKFVNKGNVKTLRIQDWQNVSKLIPEVSKHLTRNVYISVDVDGFDPSVIPATGTPEPGGFGWYEALRLFKKICAEKNIVGVDIVELSPVENQPASEFTIAKFIYKLMGYVT